jgi:hypothetical protein
MRGWIKKEKITDANRHFFDNEASLVTDLNEMPYKILQRTKTPLCRSGLIDFYILFFDLCHQGCPVNVK